MMDGTPDTVKVSRVNNGIIVRVDKEYVETFSNAFNVKPFRNTKDYSDFKIQLNLKRKGDDETVMYEIDYKLSASPSFQGWQVLWEESDY